MELKQTALITFAVSLINAEFPCTWNYNGSIFSLDIEEPSLLNNSYSSTSVRPSAKPLKNRFTVTEWEFLPEPI